MAGNTFFGNVGKFGQPVALFAGYDPSFRVMRPGMSGFMPSRRGFAGPMIGRSGFGDASYYNGQLIDDANSGGMSAGSDTGGMSLSSILQNATDAAAAAANIYTSVNTGTPAGAQMTPKTGTPYVAPYKAPAMRSSWVLPAIVAVGIGGAVVWYMKKR